MMIHIFMNFNKYPDPLTFLLAPSSGQNFNLFSAFVHNVKPAEPMTFTLTSLSVVYVIC